MSERLPHTQEDENFRLLLVEGDFEKIENFINENPKIINTNFFIKNGIHYVRSPVEYVIDNVEMVKFLVSKGGYAWRPRETHVYVSPFEQACICGNLEVVKFLLEVKDKEQEKIPLYDDSIYNQIKRGFTNCCYDGQIDILEFIHKEVDFDEIIEGFRMGIIYDKIDVINFIANNYHHPDLLLNSVIDHKIFEMMVYRYNPNMVYPATRTRRKSTTVLHKAFNRKIKEFMCVLNYTNINIVNDEGRTILFYSHKYTHKEVLEYAFNNCDLSHKDCNGLTFIEYIINVSEKNREHDFLEEIITKRIDFVDYIDPVKNNKIYSRFVEIVRFYFSHDKRNNILSYLKTKN